MVSVLALGWCSAKQFLFKILDADKMKKLDNVPTNNHSVQFAFAIPIVHFFLCLYGDLKTSHSSDYNHILAVLIIKEEEGLPIVLFTSNGILMLHNVAPRGNNNYY